MIENLWGLSRCRRVRHHGHGGHSGKHGLVIFRAARRRHCLRVVATIRSSAIALRRWVSRVWVEKYVSQFDRDDKLELTASTYHRNAWLAR
jgi:hypothetical protein